MVDTAFLSSKFCLTYMAGPVLTSFQLPSTSVLHMAKKNCFSRNVYLLIVEVCTYLLSSSSMKNLRTDGLMEAGDFHSRELF